MGLNAGPEPKVLNPSEKWPEGKAKPAFLLSAGLWPVCGCYAVSFSLPVFFLPPSAQKQLESNIHSNWSFWVFIEYWMCLKYVMQS